MKYIYIFMMQDFPHLGFKILCSLYGLYSIRYMRWQMDYTQWHFQYLHEKNEKSQKKLLAAQPQQKQFQEPIKKLE